MNSKYIVVAAIFSFALLVAHTQGVYASSVGLKVDVYVENNIGRSIVADVRGYDSNGNFETVRNDIRFDPGSHVTQIQFAKGTIEVDDSFKVCVESEAGTECATGTNGPEKKPESVYVTFNGNNGFGGSSSGSASSSASDSTSSSGSSSSSASQICILGC